MMFLFRGAAAALVVVSLTLPGCGSRAAVGDESDAGSTGSSTAGTDDGTGSDSTTTTDSGSSDGSGSGSGSGSTGEPVDLCAPVEVPVACDGLELPDRALELLPARVIAEGVLQFHEVNTNNCLAVINAIECTACNSYADAVHRAVFPGPLAVGSYALGGAAFELDAYHMDQIEQREGCTLGGVSHADMVIDIVGIAAGCVTGTVTVDGTQRGFAAEPC